MKQYEYKFIRIWLYSNEKFEELGEQGWEYCGKRDWNQYIFKRLLP